MSKFWGVLFFFTFFYGMCNARIHNLQLSNDERPVIVMTTFGYLEGGFLEVNITSLKISGTNQQPLIGFSFDKSSSSGTSSYVEREESTHGCVLEDQGGSTFEDVPRAILKIALVEKLGTYELQIKERLLHGLTFYHTKAEFDLLHRAVNKPPTDSPNTVVTTKAPLPTTTTTTVASSQSVKSSDKAAKNSEKPPSPKEKDDSANSTKPSRRKRADDKKSETSEKEETETKKPAEPTTYIPQKSLPIFGDFRDGMNLSFYVQMKTKEQIGLYELYFHNCENSESSKRNADFKPVKVEFTADIVEKNADSFLSAGDMALPLMYGVVAFLFFGVGFIWLNVLCKTEEKVFKIHYLMAVITLVKGLSVMFHSLDYYFIAKDGRTEAWAVIYYIVHLLKGILLIICLLLIGTGWAFIKYILSDRDKKLFMIVIPMQVMVNVAYIIMEETEEGNKSYYTWKNIVILVDILCCGAILIPVVWSIRHLQEASQTDGKAAINLAKLELFRHFYIMVVCYLYFTRIIVYLLEITLPFQYIWIHALFSELGAFVFFSITGFKFRPGCDNPYLRLEQCDSDEDPEEAITQSGITETITRVNKREKDVTETDEFDVLLPKQRTSKV